MHNVTTSNTNLSILDRAIKGRNRRDRDGKKRRPVTDSLIELASELEARAIAAEASVASLRLDAEVLRDVIAKQSAAMEAMEAEIAALKARLDAINEASAPKRADESEAEVSA